MNKEDRCYPLPSLHDSMSEDLESTVRDRRAHLDSPLGSVCGFNAFTAESHCRQHQLRPHSIGKVTANKDVLAEDITSRALPSMVSSLQTSSSTTDHDGSLSIGDLHQTKVPSFTAKPFLREFSIETYVGAPTPSERPDGGIALNSDPKERDEMCRLHLTFKPSDDEASLRRTFVRPLDKESQIATDMDLNLYRGSQTLRMQQSESTSGRSLTPQSNLDNCPSDLPIIRHVDNRISNNSKSDGHEKLNNGCDLSEEKTLAEASSDEYLTPYQNTCLSIPIQLHLNVPESDSDEYRTSSPFLESMSSHIDVCPQCSCAAHSNPVLLSTASNQISAGPPIQESFEQEEMNRFNPLTLENSALGETIRYMRYRAFLRWYRGAHERGWGRGATGFLCLLAGTLITFSHYSMCSAHIFPHELILIYVGAIIVLSVILALFSHTLFVPRYSVRLSLLFMLGAMGVVIVVNTQRHGQSSTKDGCAVYKWFPVCFFIVQCVLFLSGVIYSTVLDKVGQYYYLKSSWFIARWKIIKCYPVQLLVPALGQADRRSYQNLFGWRTLSPVPPKKRRNFLFSPRENFEQSKKRRHSRSLMTPTTQTTVFQSQPIVGAAPKLLQRASVHGVTEYCPTRSTAASLSNSSRLPIGKQDIANLDGNEGLRSRLVESAVRQHGSHILTAHNRPMSGSSSCCSQESNEAAASPDSDRLRVARGLRLEFSSYSAWRIRLKRAFYLLCCCWCCSRSKRRDEVSLMTPEKVGCWRRKPKRVPTRKSLRNAESVVKVARNNTMHQEMRATFIGEIDENGRPEGFGYWRDEGYDYGERLVGYWSEGFPNGPHKSREIRTGSGFMCIRIGWARYTLADNILGFGVSNVECSVSGKFYRGHPSVKLMLPPEKIDEMQGFLSVAGRVGSTRNTSVNENEQTIIPPASVTPCEFTPLRSTQDKTEEVLSFPSDHSRLQWEPFDVTTKEGKSISQVTLTVTHGAPPPGVSASEQANNAETHSTDVRRDTDEDESIVVSNEDTIDNERDSPIEPAPQLPSSPIRKRAPLRNSILGSPMFLFPRRGHARQMDTQEENAPVLAANDIPTKNNLRKSHSVSVPGKDFGWLHRGQRLIDETPLVVPGKKHLFRNFARNVPLQWKEGVAGAGATVLRILRRRDIERFARLEKSRRAVAWCLAELSPHTPNFGIQPRSELVITVDYERGLYISGYMPSDSVEQENKPEVVLSQSVEDLSRLKNIPPLLVHQCHLPLKSTKHQTDLPTAAELPSKNESSKAHTSPLSSTPRNVKNCETQMEISPIRSQKESTRRQSRERPRKLSGTEHQETGNDSTLSESSACNKKIVSRQQGIHTLTPVKSRVSVSGSISSLRGGTFPSPLHSGLSLHLKNQSSGTSMDHGCEAETQLILMSKAAIHGAEAPEPSNTSKALTVATNKKDENRMARRSRVLSDLLTDDMVDRKSSSIQINTVIQHATVPVSLKEDTEEPATPTILKPRRPWSLTPRALLGVEDKKKLVIPITVEESEAEMAATGHTPFYRRPTIEKDLHKRDIKELKLRVVKRRLIAKPEETTEQHDSIVYRRASHHDLVTCSCTCSCHHVFEPRNPEEEIGPGFPISGEPSVVYQPDANISKLDALDSSVGVETPELTADGWMCIEAAGSPEVLLYVHGYNNSHIEALQILGQMAAFGNYPNHIRLFVFSWPAGSGFWQFFKARKASEDPLTHQALADFITALRDNGIRQVHIMCHSMGARLFLKSFRSMGDTLFQRQELDKDKESNTCAKREHGRMQLVSVTFLNPEYFLDEFVEEDYSILRTFCNHISIFADAKDQALWWSETLSRRPALGKTVFGLWRRAKKSSSDILEPIDKNPPRFLNTASFFHYSSEAHMGSGRSNSNSQVYQTDGRREAECDVEWLDVDVIDTTFVDQNVHSMRHSFWNLNRDIIEDIRELLVTRKRARQRIGRLDR